MAVQQIIPFTKSITTKVGTPAAAPIVTGQLTSLPIRTVTASGLAESCESACDRIDNAVVRFACKTACSVIPGGGDPGQPFMPDCGPGFVRDSSGNCIVAFRQDPTPGVTTPAERSMGQTGLALPMATSVQTLVCPTFADGKKGLLWMNALTGEVVCLPRATNGAGFGLIRKNKPRKKAFISANDIKILRKKDALTKKAKAFAKLTGMTCAPRGRGRH